MQRYITGNRTKKLSFVGMVALLLSVAGAG